MNRKILFRGKRTQNGNWLYGSLKIDKNRCSIKEQGVAWPNALYFSVDSATIGQYTGLTDKNGVKIFEGDIVHCVSRMDDANMVVIFEDGEYRMILCEKYKGYISGGGSYTIRCFDKEVIGIIHDNPELLQ